MSRFAGWTGGVAGGVSRLVSASRNAGLERSPAWSIAELRLSHAEYTELAHWYCKRVDPKELARYLESCGRFFDPQSNTPVLFAEREVDHEAGVGLLLLAFFAEHSRRSAPVGGLWRTLSAVPCRPDVSAQLFLQGQPSTPLKSALRRATELFRLRSATESAERQRWYTTVLLQHGIPMLPKGDPSLGTWLAGGNVPISVRLLLGELERGLFRSASFCTLWETLRRVQRGATSRSDALRTLVASPWAPDAPGVVDRWLDLTMKRPEAYPKSGAPGFSSSEAAGASPDAPASSWHAPPRWAPSPDRQSAYSTALADLSRLDLTEPYYTVHIDGVRRGRLLRQGDGTYQTPTGERAPSYPLPLEPRCVLSLQDPAGASVEQDSIDLWPEDSSVLAYVNGGAPRELPLRSVPAEVFLLLAPGARLSTDEQDAKPSARWTLRAYEGPELLGLFVERDGETTQLTAASSPGGAPTPALRARALVRLSELPATRTGVLALKLEALDGALLEWVEHGGSRVGLGGVSRCDSVELALDASRGGSRCVVRVGFSSGGSETFELPWPPGLAVPGANGEWSWHSPDQPVTIRTLTRLPVRVAVPRGARDEGAVLCSTQRVALVGSRLRRAENFDGYGAPLLWLAKVPTVEGLLDAQGESSSAEAPRETASTPVPLAASVIDRGVIERGAVVAGSLQLELVDGIEHSPEKHRCVLWLDDGSVQQAPPESVRTVDAAGARWCVELPAGRTLRAAILCWEGTRLGTWWSDDWSSSLEPPRDDVARARWMRTQFRLIYWARLPVLAPQHVGAVRGLAQRALPEAWRAWLDQKPTDSECDRLGASYDFSEGWLATVRELLAPIAIQPADSARGVRELAQIEVAGKGPAPWLLGAVNLLGLLEGATVASFFAAMGEAPKNTTPREQWFARIQLGLSDLDLRRSSTVRRAAREASAQLARLFGVSDERLRALLTIDARSNPLLRALLRRSEFRRGQFIAPLLP